MDTSAVLSLIGAGWLAAMVTLVRIAITSERRRADDWRDAAKTSKAAADVMSDHVGKLTSALEQLTAAQRESIALLRGMASDRPAA